MNHIKTLEFGKIAFDGGRKVNKVTVTVSLNWVEKTHLTTELEETTGYWVLSISGDVWNSKGTDIVAGGQCLDMVKSYLGGNKLFAKVYKLWQQYHLNDMRSGTKQQLALIPEGADLVTARSILHQNGLLIDRGYCYQGAWFLEIIPIETVNEIIAMLA